MVAPPKIQRPVLTKLAAASKAVGSPASAKLANALPTKPQPSKWLSKPASFAISAAKLAAAPAVTGHGMPGANEILSMPKATKDALDAIEPGFASKLTGSTAKYLSDLGDAPEHRSFTTDNKAAVIKMLTSTDPAIQQVAKWYAAFSKRFTDVENNVRSCLEVPSLAPLARDLQAKYRSGTAVTRADFQTLIDAIKAEPDYSNSKSSKPAWARTLEQTRDLI